MNINITPYEHSTLVEILEYLDDHMDVRDGADGEPQPNDAMSLFQRLEPLVERLDKTGDLADARQREAEQIRQSTARVA